MFDILVVAVAFTRVVVVVGVAVAVYGCSWHTCVKLGVCCCVVLLACFT